MQWHTAYEDPDSSLSRRLAAVQQLIRDVLDHAPEGPIHVLSLCAGEARDITGAAHGHPRSGDISGVLVELDQELAARAAANIEQAGLALEVRCDDAGDPTVFDDAGPADLLLLAGIFGNISDDDVATTIAAAPALCAPGATVIWTRHRRPPDLTPRIRDWFDAAGFEPVDLRSEGEGGFAVGRERLVGHRPGATLPDRLFTFRDDLW